MSMETGHRQDTTMSTIIARLLASLGLLFIAVGLPWLEVSPTHVFNSDWPAHALFHEVWQLTTNAGIALLGLWLIWVYAKVRLASILGALVMGGAVTATVLGSLYGGAVTYDGGPALSLFGVHAATLIPAAITTLFVIAYILDRRK